MSDLWLTPDEVVELTERRRWSAQCRALASMGIPFRPNAAGRPLVERAMLLSSAASQAPRQRQRATPNWKAIDGKAA